MGLMSFKVTTMQCGLMEFCDGPQIKLKKTQWDTRSNLIDQPSPWLRPSLCTNAFQFLSLLLTMLLLNTLIPKRTASSTHPCPSWAMAAPSRLSQTGFAPARVSLGDCNVFVMTQTATSKHNP